MPSLYPQLRRLAGRLERQIEQAIAEAVKDHSVEVTAAQWLVMDALHGGGATTPLKAAELLDIDGGAASRLVQRLVEKGLVEREVDPEDRRSTILTLTTQGKRLVPKATKAVASSESEFMKSLNRTRQRQLSLTLIELMEAQK